MFKTLSFLMSWYTVTLTPIPQYPFEFPGRSILSTPSSFPLTLLPLVFILILFFLLLFPLSPSPSSFLLSTDVVVGRDFHYPSHGEGTSFVSCRVTLHTWFESHRHLHFVFVFGGHFNCEPLTQDFSTHVWS